MDHAGGRPAPKNTPLVVFFSSVSGNTARFVEKLEARSARLPLRTGDETLIGVPVLYRFELMGTPEDVEKVSQGLEEIWKRNHQH